MKYSEIFLLHNKAVYWNSLFIITLLHKEKLIIAACVLLQNSRFQQKIQNLHFKISKYLNSNYGKQCWKIPDLIFWEKNPVITVELQLFTFFSTAELLISPVSKTCRIFRLQLWWGLLRVKWNYLSSSSIE